MKGKMKFYLLLGFFQLVLILIVFFSIDGIITMVAAQTESYDYFNSPTAAILAISAAISFSAAVIGSAIALKTVGTAAISALSEREESFFKAFLVVAFCEALAIYGLIIAILFLTKIPNPA
ncbi:MAG: V-type ATP synthase subunit K [Promethearchaeota archaeon Loki_b31]|nr:MAG: V-type ATP synthase subunit K [Candidatus Lokiarchaeota archaeon Loki_b31]